MLLASLMLIWLRLAFAQQLVMQLLPEDLEEASVYEELPEPAISNWVACPKQDIADATYGPVDVSATATYCLLKARQD